LPSDEILAHIAPIAFGHINFPGIYRFPLERYVDQLVPSVPATRKAAGACSSYPQETVTFCRNS